MNIGPYAHRFKVYSSVSAPRNIVQLYSSVPRNTTAPRKKLCFPVVNTIFYIYILPRITQDLYFILFCSMKTMHLYIFGIFTTVPLVVQLCSFSPLFYNQLSFILGLYTCAQFCHSVNNSSVFHHLWHVGPMPQSTNPLLKSEKRKKSVSLFILDKAAAALGVVPFGRSSKCFLLWS
jgi:hypothetical protein